VALFGSSIDDVCLVVFTRTLTEFYVVVEGLNEAYSSMVFTYLLAFGFPDPSVFGALHEECKYDKG
jgi:hypothetical protein